MEDTTPNTPVQSESTSIAKYMIGFVWILSILISGIIGFAFGRNGSNTEIKDTTVLAANSQVTPTNIPSPTTEPTPQIINNNVCQKSGFAQKWEYLTPYVIKESDTLQSIVTDQLKDSSRVNEVMQINGVGPLVVGSTLYLPPKSVSKSSGNLKLISGRLIEKNTNSWHISFNGSKDGQTIIVPSFWFGEITDKDNYQVGDCLSILLDDGYKVFSVTKQ